MALTLNGTTGIAGIAGSAGTPALQGNNDTNTGYYFGTDILGLSTGGNTRLYINSDGKIGIGTATPDKEFHLERNDTSTSAIAKFKNAGTGDATLQIGTAATNFVIGMDNSDSDKFKLGYGSVLESMTGMTIDSSGKVGIGTTSPSKKLHIDTTGTSGEGILLKSTNSYYPSIIGDADRSGASLFLIALQGYWNGNRVAEVTCESGPDTTNKDDGMVVIRTRNHGDTSPQDRLTVNEAGNVGINSTTPAERLEVNGVIKITGTGGQGVNIENSGGTNAACINLKNTLTNYVREYRLAVAGSDGAYATANSLFIRDQTANATRLELNTSGDVKVSSGDITFGTAGKGIVLGNTANVDANTLDDYEEGTYVPTLNFAGSFNGTIAYQTGTYTKIGRVVHANVNLQLSNKGTTTGQLRFTLPFNCADVLASTSVEAGGLLTYFNNYGGNASTLVATPVDANNYVVLRGNYQGGDSFTVSDSNVDTNFEFRCSITYFAAS